MESISPNHSRYQQIYSQVEDCLVKTEVATFKFGLQPNCPLFSSLSKSKPKCKMSYYKRWTNIRLIGGRTSYSWEYQECEQEYLKSLRSNSENKKTKKITKKDHKPLKTKCFKGVNIVFLKPVYNILLQIKDKPYFKWPTMLVGDPSKRNQKLKYTSQGPWTFD